MVDNAHNVKWSSSVRRLTQRARLRFPDAKLGETIYEGRGIDGVLVREALTCQFMDRAANVIVEGDTGTGMSYLACCMAKQECRMRRSARCIRLPDLLMERDELAATERSDAKILRKYALRAASHRQVAIPRTSKTWPYGFCSSSWRGATWIAPPSSARSTRLPTGTAVSAAACRPTR